MLKIKTKESSSFSSPYLNFRCLNCLISIVPSSQTDYKLKKFALNPNIYTGLFRKIKNTFYNKYNIKQ